MKLTSTALLALAASVVTSAPTEVEVGAATTTSKAAQGPTPADIAKALKAHNAARAQHGEQPLTWDARLAKSAQAYSAYLAQLGTLKHNSTGENLYYRYPPTDHDCLLATNAWVAERPNYHGEVIPQGSFSAYGHYTQVVWNSTQRVGMGWTRDDKGQVFVVARYLPAGNYVGHKPY